MLSSLLPMFSIFFLNSLPTPSLSRKVNFGLRKQQVSGCEQGIVRVNKGMFTNGHVHWTIQIFSPQTVNTFVVFLNNKPWPWPLSQRNLSLQCSFGLLSVLLLYLLMTSILRLLLSTSWIDRKYTFGIWIYSYPSNPFIDMDKKYWFRDACKLLHDLIGYLLYDIWNTHLTQETTSTLDVSHLNILFAQVCCVLNPLNPSALGLASLSIQSVQEVIL